MQTRWNKINVSCSCQSVFMSKSGSQSCCLHSNLFILPWQQRRMYNKVIVIVLLSMKNYRACPTLGSTHKAFILFHCRCVDGLTCAQKLTVSHWLWCFINALVAYSFAFFFTYLHCSWVVEDNVLHSTLISLQANVQFNFWPCYFCRLQRLAGTVVSSKWDNGRTRQG